MKALLRRCDGFVSAAANERVFGSEMKLESKLASPLIAVSTRNHSASTGPCQAMADLLRVLDGE
jgi:hypothetical protein